MTDLVPNRQAGESVAVCLIMKSFLLSCVRVWALTVCLAVLMFVGGSGRAWAQGSSDPTGAAARVVTTLQDVTANDGVISLREAITSANSNPDFSAITFGVSGTFTLARRLPDLVTDMLISNGQSGGVTLSGDNNDLGRAFAVGNPQGAAITVTLENLTLANFGETGDGGAILNLAGNTLNINSSTLAGNRTRFGGGGAIFNNGTLNITNSMLFSNVTSVEGGAISNRGTLSLVGSTLLSNTAQSTGNNGLSGNGGAIFNSNGSGVTLSIANSTLSQNVGRVGGAIGGFNDVGGTITLTGSTLSDNTATSAIINSNCSVFSVGGEGGAIYSGANLTLTASTLSGNRATNRAPRGAGNAHALGGALAYFGSDANISGSTFTGNVALGDGEGSQGADGGAIYNRGTIAVFTSTFSGNTARIGGNSLSGARGGAISNIANFSLKFSTLAGNSTNGGAVRFEGDLVGGGGGVYNGANFTLVNSTLSGNSAGGASNKGGAFFNGPFQGPVATISSSTLAGNTSPQGSGIHTRGSLSLTNSIVAGNSGSVNLLAPSGFVDGGNNLTGGDPLLAPLADNGGPTQTRLPLAGSPAIDAGQSAEDFDQRGVKRPSDGNGDAVVADDIGAFELTFDSSGPSGLIVTTPADTRFDDGLTSLREAILNSNNQSSNGAVISFSPTVFALRETITLGTNSPLPAVTGTVTITGPNAGVFVTGRVGPNNALFSVGSGASASSTKLFFRGSKTGIRNAGTFNLTDGGLSGSTTNLENTGTATLLRCTVEGASTGIANIGSLTLDATRLSGNTNGIVNAAGKTATVKTSTFVDNAVGVTNNGTLTLSNSTLNQNGDGVRNQSGSATVIQSTLAGNTNAVVNSQNATLRLLRATVAGNGGGLSTGGGTVELRSTLLVGNGTNLTGTPSSGGSNLTDVTAPVAGLEVDGNGFPLLKMNGGPTATVALLAGSRAINAGEVGIKTGNDQRGTDFPRVVGGRADVGAFEFQTATAPQQMRDAAPSAGSS